MKKQIVAISVALACLSATSHAQFKLPTVPGLTKPAQPATNAPPSGDALLATFSQSQGLVMAAQQTFADALGLKDQLAGLQAEQKAMSSGAVDMDAMKKRKELSTTVQLAIDARMAEQPELTTASRAKFAEGLVNYLKAAVGARNLLVEASNFGGSLGANPMALMGKARTAMYVAKETPGYVKGVAGTTRSLLDFAKRNNIKTPANATAALDGL